MKTQLSLFFLLLAPQGAFAAQDPVFDPREFNLFSLGNINYIPNGSDVEGLVGCAGNFKANSFGLHTGPGAGPMTGISLYAGGTVTMGSATGGTQTYNGGIEAAGDVQILTSAVFGGVNTGGNCDLTNGQIHGDVNCQGSFSGSSFSVGGAIQEGAPFQATANLGWYSTYYLGQADSRADTPQNATWTVNGGVLDIQLTQMDSVVEVPAATITGLHTITVDGPSGACLSVVAPGSAFEFGNLTWTLTGGIETCNIAMVVPDARKGKLYGGPHLSIIAPRAKVRFESGALYGNLIVAGFSGAGEVHYKPWTGFTKDKPGNPYCFGDPTVGTDCPCGNNNDGSVPGSGCANGVFPSGALLIANGVASVSSDSLFLATSGVQPNTFGVYYQNDDSLNPAVHWGDGLMCSTTNLQRLGPVYSSNSGYADTSSLPVPISVKGQVAAGDTKHYGYWYRSWFNSPCGNNFNTSNAYSITWLP